MTPPESAGTRVGNKLLAALGDGHPLAGRLERVTVPLGETVAEPGRPMAHAYFPLTCVLSAVVVMEDGAVIEAATIGNEGMAGVDLLVAGGVSPYRVLQQVEGDALRLPAGEFRRALAESPALRPLMERYVLTLLHQSAQNAACLRHHVIEERMCRWLLTCGDRTGGDAYYITQEFLGEMLGVRRQSVNLTAGLLQKAGLIAYRRGRLRILDRPGLERSACECYRVTRDTYGRLMRLPEA